jgi:hypothetical protein
MSRSTRLATCLMLIMLTSVGCQSDGEQAKESAVKLHQVNLPKSPKMEIPVRRQKAADGSYTVTGLLKNIRTLLGKMVKVHGVVQRVHRCDEDALVCDPPTHALIEDYLNRPRKRLIVVGDEDTAFDTLKQGTRVTLSGRYVLKDDEGYFVRMEGLLILPALPQPKPGVSSPGDK